MDTAIYTPRQLADRWLVSYRTILRMIHGGQLPAFRVGTEWRITAEALREHESSQHTPQTPKKQKLTRIK